MSGSGKGGHVHANGIRQHYLHYGSKGPVIVLVPGITSPAITWGFIGERLGASYDTYVLDVRGRGLSQADPSLDYGVNACAGDLVGLIATLGLKQVTVLGHSMGARIAARAYSRGMSDIASLILVDPPVSGPGRRPYPSNLAWYVDSIRLACRGTDKEGMRAFCPTWTDEQLSTRAEWLHTCSEEAVLQTYRDFHEQDMHADLPALRIPTSLVVAGRGGVIQDTDVEEMERLTKGLIVQRVPDAGHMIPWDDLEAFLAAVDAHMVHVSSPGA